MHAAPFTVPFTKREPFAKGGPESELGGATLPAAVIATRDRVTIEHAVVTSGAVESIAVESSDTEATEMGWRWRRRKGRKERQLELQLFWTSLLLPAECREGA